MKQRPWAIETIGYGVLSVKRLVTNAAIDAFPDFPGVSSDRSEVQVQR